MPGLFVVGGAVIAALLLLSLPFSLAAGIELGLHGARFAALFRAVLVALAATTVLVVLAFAVLPPSGWGRAIMSIERTARLVIWVPELVIATAFGLHAFLHRYAPPPPRAWLAGLAMAASAEALMWMRLVFPLLPGYRRADVPAAAEWLGVALAGVTGVLVLIVPGWIIGCVLRWQGGAATPRFAWVVWPCWMLGSTALRLYGPSPIR